MGVFHGPAVHLTGEPGQLFSAGDLIYAASIGRYRFQSLSIPGRGGRQGNGYGCLRAGGDCETGGLLCIALSLDQIVVIAIGKGIAAVLICRHRLSVPGDGNGGYGRRFLRGDGKGHVLRLRLRQCDVLADRRTGNRQAAALAHLAESGDGVGIIAVREPEGPHNAVPADCGSAGHALDAHHGPGVVDGEGRLAGGHLEGQDGIAVVPSAGRGHKRLTQGGRQALQLVRRLGRGVGVRAQGVQVVDVGNRSRVFIADGRIRTASGLDRAGGIAVLQQSVAAAQIAGDSAGIPAAAFDGSAVIAAVNRHRSVYVAHNAAGLVPRRDDAAQVGAGTDRLAACAVAACDVANNAAHILRAVDRGLVDTVLNGAVRTVKLSHHTGDAV